MLVYFFPNRAILRRIFQFTILLSFTGFAFAAPGDLDPTFGTGGRVQVSVGSEALAYAAVLQPDGKIIVGGKARTNRNYADFILARFNPDGNLDPTFGTGGVVSTNLNITSAPRYEIHAIALQPDGKIVATGSVRTTGGSLVSTGIVRYNPNGSLDTTFGSGGIIIFDAGAVRAVVVQPDGKIVFGGGGGSSSLANFQFVRLNSNGTADATFGTNGTVIIDFNGSGDGIYGLALQTDGKIVGVGQSRILGGDDNFGVARLNPDGSLDTTFGTGGKVTTDFAELQDYGFAVTIQPDGKILVAGQAQPQSNDWDFGLVRYNIDGSLDTTFGNGGKVTTPFGVVDGAFAVKLQSNGKSLPPVFGAAPARVLRLPDIILMELSTRLLAGVERLKPFFRD